MRRLLRGTLAVIGLVLAVTALLLSAQETSVESAYRRLGEHMDERQDGGQTPKRDWNRILDENNEAVGWITVEGTAIDYPVVQPAYPTASDFYLSHDFWRRVDAAGCPYLDERADIVGAHVMIFGHRLGPTNRMFGSLSGVWEQQAFKKVGAAHLETPNESLMFSPLCALKVDYGFTDIQHFGFDGDDDMRLWLSGLVQRASAHNADAGALLMKAKRVLTLVTCSSVRGGSSERTLMMFVSED